VDDYAKGQDHFPKNRRAVLHLLDKHSKTTKPKQTSSEGHTFVTQKGGKGAKKATSKPITFNPADWTNKSCFVCGEKAIHPTYTVRMIRLKSPVNDKSYQRKKMILHKAVKEASPAPRAQTARLAVKSLHYTNFYYTCKRAYYPCGGGQ
jgi:hypothetical protein